MYISSSTAYRGFPVYIEGVYQIPHTKLHMIPSFHCSRSCFASIGTVYQVQWYSVQSQVRRWYHAIVHTKSRGNPTFGTNWLHREIKPRCTAIRSCISNSTAHRAFPLYQKYVYQIPHTNVHTIPSFHTNRLYIQRMPTNPLQVDTGAVPGFPCPK